MATVRPSTLNAILPVAPPGATVASRRTVDPTLAGVADSIVTLTAGLVAADAGGASSTGSTPSAATTRSTTRRAVISPPRGHSPATAPLRSSGRAQPGHRMVMLYPSHGPPTAARRREGVVKMNGRLPLHPYVSGDALGHAFPGPPGRGLRGAAAQPDEQGDHRDEAEADEQPGHREEAHRRGGDSAGGLASPTTASGSDLHCGREEARGATSPTGTATVADPPGSRGGMSGRVSADADPTRPEIVTFCVPPSRTLPVLRTV